MARVLAGLTLVTYALAVEQAIGSSFGGWIFLLSEPLYWPTLAGMVVIAGGIARVERLRPWRLLRATAEADLRTLCRFALRTPAFTLCFWLNWLGALVLPVYLLVSMTGMAWPVRASVAGEALSTFLWRLPALWHARRGDRSARTTELPAQQAGFSAASLAAGP